MSFSSLSTGGVHLDDFFAENDSVRIAVQANAVTGEVSTEIILLYG
jgi:hypothetical protein